MSSGSSVPTRQRLVVAAAELFRRQGYAATGIKAILVAAGAPSGSLYHFFPGGKVDLAQAAIEDGSAAYLTLIESYFRADTDPVAATEEFFADGVDLLESTGFADACPIATLAGEIADTYEPLRLASHAAFGQWMDALAANLVTHGADAAVAHAVGVELFCLIEGAFLLSRTSRSAEPLRIVARRAVTIVAEALTPTANAARPTR